MDGILGTIFSILAVILTIVFYVIWTKNEDYEYVFQQKRNEHRVFKIGICFIGASTISYGLYYVLSKILVVAVIAIKWLFIYACLTIFILAIIGIFTKKNNSELQN